MEPIQIFAACGLSFMGGFLTCLGAAVVGELVERAGK